MSIKSYLSLVLAITSLFAFASCSQGGNLPNHDGTPEVSGSNSLPALPDARIASAGETEYFTAGMSIVDGNNAYELDPESGTVYLGAYKDELAWTVYGIPASDYGNSIDLGMFVDEGQEAWVAIADYELGSWRIAPSTINGETAVPTIPFDPAFLSPINENMYIAVICMPGNMVQVNGFAYIYASLWDDFWEWYHHDVELTGMTLTGKTTWGPRPIVIGSRKPGEQATAKATGYACNFLHVVVSYNWTIAGGPATLAAANTGTSPTNTIKTGACTKGQTITVSVTATCTGGLTTSVASSSFNIV